MSLEQTEPRALLPARWPRLHQGSCGLVEIGPRPHGVVRRQLQPEPIALVAREDMKMRMEDVLARSLTVSKEKVDSLARNIRRPQGGRGELSNAEQLRSVLGIQIGETRRVTSGNDDHVPRHERLDVHECHRSLVLVDDAGLGLA